MGKGCWRRKLEKFHALNGEDRWMLIHATVWLGLARVMLLVLPFPRLAKRLSAKEDESDPRPDAELMKRIGQAVQAVAGNVPWRADCFPQGIAGWMMLKHHGHTGTIHLGVERSGKEDLIGHAWLTCGDTVITGGNDSDRYTEMLPL